TGLVAPETMDAVGYLEGIGSRPPPGLAVFLGGDAVLGDDYMSLGFKFLHTTTVVTPLLVIALLVVISRSLLAPLVPLLTIGASVWVSQAALALLPGFGRRLGLDLEVSDLVQVFNLVLLFGAGTDYCLFLIWRFREELARGLDVPGAVAQALERTAAALAAS